MKNISLFIFLVLTVPGVAQTADNLIDFESLVNGQNATNTQLANSTHGSGLAWQQGDSAQMQGVNAAGISCLPTPTPSGPMPLMGPVTVGATTYPGIGSTAFQYTTGGNTLVSKLAFFTPTSDSVEWTFALCWDIANADTNANDLGELSTTLGAQHYAIPLLNNGHLKLETNFGTSPAVNVNPNTFYWVTIQFNDSAVASNCAVGVCDKMNVYDNTWTLLGSVTGGNVTSSAKANFILLGTAGDAPQPAGKHWWYDNMFLCYSSSCKVFPLIPTVGCRGSNPTRTSSPDETSVQACATAAATGTTINVDPGTATWPTRVSASNKNIILNGAGAGNTNIYNSSFILDNCNQPCEVKNFTFNVASNYLQITNSLGWRVDHDIFTVTPSGFMMLTFGSSSQNTGLFDHNTTHDGQLVVFGESSGTGGQYRWSEPLNLGTSSAVYAEDNTALNSVSGVNNAFTECNYGGRVITRFNTLAGTRLATHGTQVDNGLGCVMSENYNNTLTNVASPSFRPFFFRGGVNMVFHNTTDHGYSNNNLNIDVDRAEEDSIAAQLPNWQFCDGLAQSNNTGGFTFTHGKIPVVDGGGTGGYPCLTQIGRGPMATRWTNFSGTPPAQPLVPNYLWKNTDSSGEIPTVLACETSGDQLCLNQAANIILQNRDYYTYNSSPGSNQTTGVAEGTLAARPANCTTGVGYWATDVGTWNVSGNGAGQGVLYVCTGLNTWTLFYTPYTYPHPLQSGILAQPSFSPNGGTFNTSQSVTESCGSGPTGCYRTDGGTPGAATPGTCDSAPTQTYSSPFSVSSATTVTGLCTQIGFINSGISSAGFAFVGITSYNPSSKDFGSIQVLSSSAQVFVMTNSSAISASLSLGTITTTGPDASMFALSGDTCSGQTIAAGNTCSFTYTFTPTSAGAKSATVSIPGNQLTTDTIALSGTGTQASPPINALAPAGVMF